MGIDRTACVKQSIDDGQIAPPLALRTHSEECIDANIGLCADSRDTVLDGSMGFPRAICVIRDVARFRLFSDSCRGGGILARAAEKAQN